MKHSASVAAFAALLTVPAFAGRNLIWTGQASSVWNDDDPTALNWRVEGDPDNTPVLFQSGDNVRFDDTAVNPSVILTQSKFDPVQNNKQVFQFNVGDCIVSNETKTITINQSSKWGIWAQAAGEWASFRKQGSGQLDVKCRLDYKCDFICEAGTFKAEAGSNWSGEFRSCVGSLHDRRKVTFGPGSTAWLSENWVFGAVGSASLLTLVYDNCTVKSGSSGNMSAGNVYYSNTVFDVTRANPHWGYGNVHFGGDRQMVIGGQSNVLLGQAGGGWLNVYVDDVTGDLQSDVVISNNLWDFETPPGNSKGIYRTHFRKYGSGTLELCGGNSSTTGEIQVLEGTLRTSGESPDHTAAKTPLGDLTGSACKRTFLVSGPNARFDMKIVPFKCQCPCDWTLRVENGATLDWSLSSQKRAYFGELYLDNAKVVPSEVGSFWMDYGAMAVTKKLTLKGKTPYVLAPPNSVNAGKELMFVGFTPDDLAASLANPTSPAGHTDFTNVNSRLEIAVDDITGSKATDATIGYILCDMRNLTYKPHSDYSPTATGAWTSNPLQKCANRGGIRKTGAGTLELTKSNQYTLETDVAEGTLWVSGSCAKSSGAIVRANAYLGGTGTMPATTVEANGGFVARAGQAKGLTVQSLTVNGAARVKVETDELKSGSKFPLLVVTDKPVSMSFDGWTFDCTQPFKKRGFKMSYDAATGAVTVNYDEPGFILTVR